MPQRSWSIPLGLIACLVLLFALGTSSAWSQSNVAKVIITDEKLVAESRPGEHPLITAHVSVLDNNNAHVGGLRPEDFSVKEWPNPISDFTVSEERQGVAVALLVDISGSMADQGTEGTRLQDVQRTLERFVGSLGDKDMATIFTFCKNVRQVQPLTAGQKRMGSWVSQAITIPVDGTEQYTCLFDAMWSAINELTGSEEKLGPEFARMKKAIFVFSDGADTGRESGCMHDLVDVKKLLIAKDPKGKISVYAVGVGSEKKGESQKYPANFHDLKNLADITEGEFIHYFGRSEWEKAGARRELDKAFDRFLSQGVQYVIRYNTKACAEQVMLSVGVGGQTDEIEVKIPPVDPVIKLSGVQKGQVVSGIVDLKPQFLLEQCPIREVTYYVCGVKEITVGPPFAWQWDTLSLLNNPNCSPMEAGPEGNGLIKDIVLRVEAIDQKGHSAIEEVSDLTVEIPPPEVEITAPAANTSIERTGSWRTRLEDMAPRELPVRIKVTWPRQRRKIERVEYYLDGQPVGPPITAPPFEQYTLDISTLGTINAETQHTLKVRVTDELNLVAEAEVPLIIKVHAETFWGMVGRLVGRQLNASMLIAVLSMLFASSVLVVFLRSPQRMIQPVRRAFVAVTEALGILEKAELLELQDNKVVNRYRVRQHMNFGRDPDQADITFDDPRVSRLHATLRKEGDNFVLYDRYSKHGTWINERRLPFGGSEVLNDGDIIGLGPVRLLFKREDELEPEIGIEQEQIMG